MPNLGFPYFNFLGEAQCKKTPCTVNYTNTQWERVPGNTRTERRNTVWDLDKYIIYTDTFCTQVGNSPPGLEHEHSGWGQCWLQLDRVWFWSEIFLTCSCSPHDMMTPIKCSNAYFVSINRDPGSSGTGSKKRQESPQEAENCPWEVWDWHSL